MCFFGQCDGLAGAGVDAAARSDDGDDESASDARCVRESEEPLESLDDALAGGGGSHPLMEAIDMMAIVAWMATPAALDRRKGSRGTRMRLNGLRLHRHIARHAMTFARCFNRACKPDEPSPWPLPLGPGGEGIC